MKPLTFALLLLLSSFLLAQDSAPASRAVVPPRFARITGRVVDDVTGLPVSAFELGVAGNVTGITMRTWGVRRIESPDGRFDHEVDLLQTEEHRSLLATSAGYAGGRSALLLLTDGERIDDVEIRLIRGATVAGRVLDSTGSPIKDVSVTLERPPLPPGTIVCGGIPERVRELPDAKTDSNGSFALPHLFSGEFVLAIRHPDFGPHQTESFTIPTSGRVVRPDVSLTPGGVVRGRVALADGAPDSRASVMVHRIDSRFGGLHHRSVSTDAKGRYEIGGLEPGEYTVLVGMRDGKPDLTGLFSPQTRKLVSVTSRGVVELDL